MPQIRHTPASTAIIQSFLAATEHDPPPPLTETQVAAIVSDPGFGVLAEIIYHDHDTNDTTPHAEYAAGVCEKDDLGQQTREIPLTRGYVAEIDECDYERVSAFKWHTGFNKVGKPYAKRTVNCGGKFKTVSMHRFITGAPDGSPVDHADMNMLHNRRGNLRVCTSSLNAANRGLHTSNTSGFKGVHFQKRAAKWRAVIQVDLEKRHLGYYEDASDAAHAYDAAARLAFGEFARLNFPDAGEASASIDMPGQAQKANEQREEEHEVGFETDYSAGTRRSALGRASTTDAGANGDAADHAGSRGHGTAHPGHGQPAAGDAHARTLTAATVSDPMD